MARGCLTIYKTSRQQAHLTQEQAYDLLGGLSLDCLKDYEQGIRRPPDEIVLRMVRIYDDKMLGYEHLRATELGMVILPNLEVCESIETATLRYQRDMARIHDVDSELINIACDGVIDEKESTSWNGIKSKISNAVGTLLSLTLIKTKNCQRGNADSSKEKYAIDTINIPRIRRPIKGAR